MSVIKEVPVYLSKSCMESLLLFEFPSRPKSNPISDTSVLECKYKPKFHHAELSLSLDTGSANYERHRGQELGRLAPEQFPRGLYDRQLLRSQPCMERQQQQQQRQRCAVARFHGNRLVLCPMPAGARLVMQPVLEHLDAKPEASEAAAAAAAAASVEVEAKAVTLRFARQETPEARQRREQSYRVCHRLLDQQPWLTCRWLGVSDSSLSSSAPGSRRRRCGSGSRRPHTRRRQCVSMCEGGGGADAAAAAIVPGSPGRPPAGPDGDGGDGGGSDGGDDQLERAIRDFLLGKLQDRLVARADELVRFFRAECDPATTLARPLPPSEEAVRRMFDSAAEALGLIALPGGSGGGGGGCLYALASGSQSHAGHRRQLLEALKSGGCQVTLGQLRARFDAAGLEPMPEQQLKALVKEYCAFRGKSYYAKGYQHGA